MLPNWAKPFSTAANNYTLYGVAFGMCFPVIATGIRLWEQSLTPGFASILQVQSTDRILLIIDSAPLWLGLFARIGGVLRDKVQVQISSLEAQVEERTSVILKEKALLHERSEEIRRESAARQEEAEQRLQVEKHLRTVANGVTRMVAEVLELLSEITSMSQQLDQDSEMNLTTTQSVNTRAERVSQLVQTMSGEAANLRGLSSKVQEESMKTRQLTDATMDCQNESRKITRQLENRLGEIEKHSSSIQQIARRTNLLALNAQIEATAAGEAGLGFQVVAENVKAMASSTNQSSIEIQETMHILLEDSVQNIESVEQSAKLLDQVHSGILRVDEQMQAQKQGATQMADGLQESSDSISIILNEMKQLDEIAQRTKQGAHLTREALVKLQLASKSLSELVVEFNQ